MKGKEFILLKVVTTKNVRFANFGFLMTDSNFMTLYAMVLIIWKF